MGNCAMDRKSYQINIDIQCDDIKSLYQEAKQLFQQEDRIILTPIMKISPNIYIKLENMQISGSFKYRGAYLYFHQIYNDKVIIASSGNFAKACDLAHQKITKERQILQSRHSKIRNFMMGSSLHKNQENEDYKRIQTLERQQTKSISESGQQETQGQEQNKTQSQIVQEPQDNQQFAFRKSVELYEHNKKAYRGQLSSDEQDDYQGYDKYNNFSSPNQSYDFKHERDLSVMSLSSQLNRSQLNFYETPTDNPDQEGLESQKQQIIQKFSNGNTLQFQSKQNDLKNENNKQSNNPIQLDYRVLINQEYETPTPLPDDEQQQIDIENQQNLKEENNKNNSNQNRDKVVNENTNNNINSKQSNLQNEYGNGNIHENGKSNGNGNGNSHNEQDDAIQQLNNQLKEDQIKESAKDFIKLKGSTYTFTQSNHLKDSKQLGLQIDKTGSQLIIVVPETVKQEKIKDIKSQVVKFSQDCVECEVHARQYANQNPGYRYFSPYNDIYMVAGNATIGYEIAEQLAEVSKQADYLFVAVGGGGLIAGIAFYFKVIREQKIKIIGVQPEKNCAMYNIIYGKNNILEDTVCDATAGGVEFDAMTIQICKLMVDEWVLVREQDILKGQKKLWNDHKIIVETSAAMAFVACENYQKISSKTYVALLCGGNVDIQF